MESSINLRKFETNDLNQVIYINQTCLPENYSQFFYINLYKQYPNTFIVAEEEGNIIGYIMCRIESGLTGLNFPPFNLTKKGHIISIAVLPEHRSKGVGHALINLALRSMATCYQVRRCYLEVRVSNGSAIYLYKSLGFEIEKTVKRYYSDGENAYVMNYKF